MIQITGGDLLEEFDLEQAKTMVGQTIEVCGCIHRIREMGAFSFVVLRTGRYLLQTVDQLNVCKNSSGSVKEGCFVKASGTLSNNEKAPGGIEMQLRRMTLLSEPAADYPLYVAGRKLGCSLEINLDQRSVALRHPRERAVFKIQEGVVSAFREFMLQNHFTEIHSPKIVAHGAEGGANIFHLEYFDQEAYLNQSPQFYKQTAVAFFDRVFEIAPVYRAEKHATARHLNEYIGLDFEMGFIDSMYDVMQMETAMLRYVMEYLQKQYAYELELLEVKLPEIQNIPSITFLEAMELLRAKGKNRFDLEPEDEVFLCEWAKKEYNSELIFVTHFPAAKRPFYAMNDREDPRAALSFDLLFRGLEITTGGQRIHDYQEQVKKMQEYNMNPAEFEDYLAIHKYGMPPHGGLGIGLERLVMKLADLSNIRQASMFPRDLNRLLP